MKKKNSSYSNIFRTKQFFLYFGLVIILSSALFTGKLARDLALEEEKKIEVWAEATRFLSTTEENNNNINKLVLKIIEENTTIPVIISDSKRKVLDSRNLNLPKSEKEKEKYYQKFIERSIEKKNEFSFPLLDQEYLYVHYNDSTLLQRLQYYPYIQLTVILIFCLLAIYSFRSTKRSEEDRIWVGLTRETAHQLGTPISSLLAWIELLKIKHPDDKLTPEIEKDINRLSIIADRFSKIGSRPDLSPVNINEQVDNAVEYMRKRSSKKVNMTIHNSAEESSFVKINIPLFEWVIENIFKNAIDAMNGEGDIDVFITQKENDVFIDIKDSGKGLEKSKFKSIFKPGFTSKERGWGLGLSLSKRIIEDYHNGKIFVKESEKNVGTCFRIILKTDN